MNYTTHLRAWLAEYRQHVKVYGSLCADVAFGIEIGSMV